MCYNYYIMNQILTHSTQVLTENEKSTVGKVEDWLKEKNTGEFNLVHDRFQRLYNLGNAVFEYPSIKETRFVKDILLNEHQLTESLLFFSSASPRKSCSRERSGSACAGALKKKVEHAR